MKNELYDICRMTLLYVDDDPDITLMVGTRFAQNYANQIFMSADNGNDAIEKTRLYKPDLFIVDLNMPLVSGLQCVRQIQRVDKNKEIAVISVCKDEDKILECLQSGVRYFIPKPINFDLFFYQIDYMMERIFWKRLSCAKSLHYLCPDTDKHADLPPSRRREKVHDLE
jgi:DNA-binding NarL/FixJ family response regulator